MGFLVLVRHGESRWNSMNKFTGWVDIPLSEVGINEALICAKQLEGLRFDIAFTSKLERAQETLLIILSKQDYTGVFVHDSKKEKRWAAHAKDLDDSEIPVYSDDALNERHYGRLQGLDKDKMRKKYGEKKVFLWRRSYDTRPPGGESLKDNIARTLPYFKKNILPHVRAGKNVIISAHGNSLRGIIKYIDNITEKDIPTLELPTGKPIIYKYENKKIVREDHIHSFNRPIHWERRKLKDNL